MSIPESTFVLFVTHLSTQMKHFNHNALTCGANLAWHTLRALAALVPMMDVWLQKQILSHSSYQTKHWLKILETLKYAVCIREVDAHGMVLCLIVLHIVLVVPLEISQFYAIDVAFK